MEEDEESIEEEEEEEEDDDEVVEVEGGGGGGYINSVPSGVGIGFGRGGRGNRTDNGVRKEVVGSSGFG